MTVRAAIHEVMRTGTGALINFLRAGRRGRSAAEEARPAHETRKKMSGVPGIGSGTKPIAWGRKSLNVGGAQCCACVRVGTAEVGIFIPFSL